MRFLPYQSALIVAGAYFWRLCLAGGAYGQQQQPLAAKHDDTAQGISISLFSNLERLARLVDISYCVGMTGISPPFSCASRCKEFPALELVQTWNTGILMSDSCGYIAVDHGEERPELGVLPPGDDNTTRAIIVAFRGTYSITNTIMDLSTTPQEYVPYPEPDDPDTPERDHKCTNCTVHMGFLASWRNARKLVLPALEKAHKKHPTYPIHLVGHSLGGAVAVLAALELKVALKWDNIRITTFGEPRVGNKGLVEFVDKVFDMEQDDGYDKDLERRIYQRVTHMNDPVPLLPLTEWGYRSHAGEIFISKSDLQPAPEDLRICRGDDDTSCIAGAESSSDQTWVADMLRDVREKGDLSTIVDNLAHFPARLKLWQLFFAHRDYFWRLGLCVPGGDPADWGREKYNFSRVPEEIIPEEL